MIKPTLISLIATSAIVTAAYSSWTDAGSEVAVQPTSTSKPCLKGPILIPISPVFPWVQTPIQSTAPETSSPPPSNADAIAGGLIVGISGLGFLIYIFSR